MLAILTAIVGIMGVFVTIGVWVDNSMKEDEKKEVADTLQQAAGRVTNLNIWRFFLVVFDSVFDKDHRGRPEFLRAGFVSCLILGGMTLRWRLVYEDRAAPVLTPLSDGDDTIIMGATLITLVVFLNWIGDYFSLWETRVVMDRMAKAKNWMLQTLWIGIDIMATVAIYWVGMSCALVVLSAMFPEYYGEARLVEIWALLWSVFFDGGLTLNHESSDADPFAIFFHTSLFTSVWAWALMAGFILWSLFRPLLTRIGRFGTLYARFPVACLMLVGSFFAGCVFAAIDQALEAIS